MPENNFPGLYVHIPFCVKKCAYCDFYSAEQRDFRMYEYKEAVLRNLSRYSSLRFDTVYFGGGTPSLMSSEIAQFIRAVNIEKNAEITAECNPETADERTLSQLRIGGVNRISFGIQSFSDEELKILGRIHSAQTARRAIILAKEAGFENISADIMLAVPAQTPKSLDETLRALYELPVDHVSAYMLKIEKNTPFYKNSREILPLLPDEDLAAGLYLQAVESLEAHGFSQYEISNFSKPGYESRHNLKYWLAREYVGVGPSAHSYFNGKRTAVPRDLKQFIENRSQIEEILEENPDKAEEKLLLGLRLTSGVELDDRLREKLKKIPPDLYKTENGRLRLTPRGFLVSNEIISELL